jgi:hypothetical protein
MKILEKSLTLKFYIYNKYYVSYAKLKKGRHINTLKVSRVVIVIRFKYQPQKFFENCPQSWRIFHLWSKIKLYESKFRKFSYIFTFISHFHFQYLYCWSQIGLLSCSYVITVKSVMSISSYNVPLFLWKCFVFFLTIIEPLFLKMFDDSNKNCDRNKTQNIMLFLSSFVRFFFFLLSYAFISITLPWCCFSFSSDIISIVSNKYNAYANSWYCKTENLFLSRLLYVFLLYSLILCCIDLFDFWLLNITVIDRWSE